MALLKFIKLVALPSLMLISILESNACAMNAIKPIFVDLGENGTFVTRIDLANARLGIFDSLTHDCIASIDYDWLKAVKQMFVCTNIADKSFFYIVLVAISGLVTPQSYFISLLKFDALDGEIDYDFGFCAIPANVKIEKISISSRLLHVDLKGEACLLMQLEGQHRLIFGKSDKCRVVLKQEEIFALIVNKGDLNFIDRLKLVA